MKLKRLFNKVRYGIPRLIRYHVFNPISNIIWYIKYHTTHRYHVLNISDSKNWWSYGWQDVDNKILFASFKLLCEFVEKELPTDTSDWEHNEEYKKARTEIAYLYKWWTVERPNQLNVRTLNSVEFYNKDTEHVQRLVAIRQYLWT